MRRKRYLYHVTDPRNMRSIREKGLVRHANRPAIAVYLSESPMSWYREGLRILRVDISGLSHIKATTFLPDSDEVLFWGDIPYWKSVKDGVCVARIKDVTDKYVKRSESDG